MLKLEIMKKQKVERHSSSNTLRVIETRLKICQIRIYNTTYLQPTCDMLVKVLSSPTTCVGHMKKVNRQILTRYSCRVRNIGIDTQ